MKKNDRAPAVDEWWTEEQRKAGVPDEDHRSGRIVGRPAPYALSIGNGGWVRWELIDPPISGFVRFQRKGERLAIAELYMPQAPSAGDLRKLPLAPLEARANDRHDILRELVEQRIDVAAPLLATAVSYFTSTAHGAEGWVRDMLMSQASAFGVPSVEPRPLPPVIPPHDREVDAYLGERKRPFPPDFYEQYAAVYGALAARYHDPNQRIADANNVTVKAVEHWNRQARARGFLPKAAPGKRG